MKDPQKTFILGVGAQKAGTTWVYDQISKSKSCDTGALKEYHIWDAVFRPDLKSGLISKTPTDNADIRLRRLFQEKTDAYFDYFSRILERPDISVTADITPSYCSLSAKHFEFIKSEFSKRGIRVKVLFLMRDPFERVWSMTRMNFQNGKFRRMGYKNLKDPCEGLLLNYPSIRCKVRNDYHKTLTEIWKAFEPDEIGCFIYEEIFGVEGTRGLEDFLGLVRGELDVDLFVKKGESYLAPSEDIIKEVVNNYADVYHYCACHFPQTKELWYGFRYLY